MKRTDRKEKTRKWIRGETEPPINTNLDTKHRNSIFKKWNKVDSQ